MRGAKWQGVHPLTQRSIYAHGPHERFPMTRRQCGCKLAPSGDGVWLCGYHEGFDAGVKAVQP